MSSFKEICEVADRIEEEPVRDAAPFG